MRRNEITYVNNNVHNNPHLQRALLKTTLHTFPLCWHGAWHTINTRVAQKQNPKALQENPDGQATQRAGQGVRPLTARSISLFHLSLSMAHKGLMIRSARNRIRATSTRWALGLPKLPVSGATSTEQLCRRLCRQTCV